ncbi:MAG: glutamate--cysteine ligase [Thermoplasmata archaeon]|nr:glutamate--cysteine ligase [Thermoplasmata archaeon]
MKLKEALRANADEVHAYLEELDARLKCPIYASMDIRHNADKAAIVDANAFPAGFHNLVPAARRAASDVARGYLHRNHPGAKLILVLAESHTRNLAYHEHLAALRGVLEAAGYEVLLGMRTQGEPVPAGLHAVERRGDALWADGRRADLVILNHDLSGGVPPELEDLAQPVNPPLAMGWHRRRKSEHFAIANRFAHELGDRIGLDGWLLSAEFAAVDGVGFRERRNLEAVADAVDAVVARVAEKQAEHGIRRAPAVFVKADAGTYGRAITTATSGRDFLASLNARNRAEMDRGKGSQKTEAIIVQESVPTSLRRHGVVAEPVLYAMCSVPVGMFHRLHDTKGDDENLNAPGARFEPVLLPGQEGDGYRLEADAARVDLTLGRLHALATGQETMAMRQNTA